ncbi:glutathione S-transferase family protein [Cribrihabitans neustonicus]|uniref:glutathione S-transferase family protein n=1 Tax=Cribrihabitans neustonicus TaxID=1429085 RepID=UPI003B5CC345
MTETCRLHYAPDNASLIVRLVLEELRLPYTCQLVDRGAGAHQSPDYLALNPHGLIPVLETPDGPIFETAAILLWLSGRQNAMAPAELSSERAGFLKWLVFTSNTLHADLRMLFYPEKYVGSGDSHQTQLRHVLRERLHAHLKRVESAAAERPSWLGAPQPSVLDYYLACLLRWMALYPANDDRSWFALGRYPCLQRLCAGLEQRPATAAAQAAEGLGPRPFTSPVYANPPEGSAT